jgi:uncharacterized protein YdaU (DUF1376 family)
MASKTDIWMPLYIGDYLADTMHLQMDTHGGYLLLIMAYWKQQGPLAENKLAGICRCSKDAWSIARPILAEFFDTTSEPGWWRHKRIDRELALAGAIKEKHVARAKVAAAKRWSANSTDATSNATSNACSTPQAMLEQCPSPSPSQSQSPSESTSQPPSQAQKSKPTRVKSVTAAMAAALGLSTRKAIYLWPEELTTEQEDRVNGAAMRLGLLKKRHPRKPAQQQDA